LIARQAEQVYNISDRNFPTRAALALIAEKGTVWFIGLLEHGPCRLSVLFIRDAVKENQPCTQE
jgi:hypothetical protein